MNKTKYMKAVLQQLSEVSPQADSGGARKAEGVPSIVAFADWDYYYLSQPISWKPNPTQTIYLPAVHVPRGFVTDLTSVPRLFWPILPPAERYAHAAIVHDFLYWEQTVSKSVADKIFNFAMMDLNVARWKRVIIYQAVNWFGKAAWLNNSSAKNSGESRLLKKFPKNPLTSWSDWKSRADVFF